MTAPAAPSELNLLTEVLGHRFADAALVTEALTHRSAATPGGHRFGYERLEFLGDRVLGLVIADFLIASFPDEPEGAIARRLTALVRRETLERVAATLDIGRHLILSAGEERAGVRRNAGIQADACEAVIGALYLDGGLETARGFILRYWMPLIETVGRPLRDAKTRLQEWAQARGLDLPEYSLLTQSGPPHAPSFVMEVAVAQAGTASGEAPSKRAAEQAAAETLLGAIDAGGDGE